VKVAEPIAGPVAGQLPAYTVVVILTNPFAPLKVLTEAKLPADGPSAVYGTHTPLVRLVYVVLIGAVRGQLVWTPVVGTAVVL